MQISKNVLAAITGAIGMYVLAEEQAAVAAALEVRKPPVEMPRPSYSPWAMAGRQSAMEMRRFFQMRLVS